MGDYSHRFWFGKYCVCAKQPLRYAFVIDYQGSESPGYHWNCSIASSTNSPTAVLNNISDIAGDWAVGINVEPTAVANVRIMITSWQALKGGGITLAALLIIIIFLLCQNSGDKLITFARERVINCD